jgi:hypothetical protein
MSAELRKMKFAWDYFVRGKHRLAQNSGWEAPQPLTAQLWFGDLWVADLHQLSPHQGTWSSEYTLRITQNQGELQDQLLEYIAFCEDFHQRIGEGRDHDFDEFTKFASIPDCQSWNAKLPTGHIVPMEGRMWFGDRCAGWQHPETVPSTEGAACEFWMQNAPSINHCESGTDRAT